MPDLSSTKITNAQSRNHPHPTVTKARPLMQMFDVPVRAANPNKVENRFLLLFSDTLVVSKFHDNDVLQQ